MLTNLLATIVFAFTTNTTQFPLVYDGTKLIAVKIVTTITKTTTVQFDLEGEHRTALFEAQVGQTIETRRIREVWETVPDTVPFAPPPPMTPPEAVRLQSRADRMRGYQIQPPALPAP